MDSQHSQRACGKLPESPAVIKRASQGKSSFGLTRTQEPEEKAGSDSQNSVSPGVEPTHTGFTNHSREKGFTEAETL